VAEVVEDVAGETSAPSLRVDRQIEQFQDFPAWYDYSKRQWYSVGASNQE
jgi:hypothetical protein